MEFHRIIQEMRDASILVLANKQDLPNGELEWVCTVHYVVCA